MRMVIFGANGQTGRQLTEQALAAGHDVAAVTRRPAEFPITHDRLAIVEADVHDARLWTGQSMAPTSCYRRWAYRSPARRSPSTARVSATSSPRCPVVGSSG